MRLKLGLRAALFIFMACWLLYSHTHPNYLALTTGAAVFGVLALTYITELGRSARL